MQISHDTTRKFGTQTQEIIDFAAYHQIDIEDLKYQMLSAEKAGILDFNYNPLREYIFEGSLYNATLRVLESKFHFYLDKSKRTPIVKFFPDLPNYFVHAPADIPNIDQGRTEKVMSILEEMMSVSIRKVKQMLVNQIPYCDPSKLEFAFIAPGKVNQATNPEFVYYDVFYDKIHIGTFNCGYKASAGAFIADFNPLSPPPRYIQHIKQ